MTTPLFCFDTSAFIESWHRNYAPDVFPGFWKHLEAAIADGSIISPDIVLAELKRQDDDVHKWCANYDGDLFLPLDEDIQLAQAKIINQFPRLTNKRKQQSLADPWVIALSQLRQCPVVSMEQPRTQENPRIPDVCYALDIKCLYVLDFIREIGWKY